MLTIDTIIEKLRQESVSEEKLQEVRTSYLLAKEIHKNQLRQSGEPYIIHPLHVANNLLEMEVYDPDTISAALLHDTIEDAEIEFTKKDVAELINPDVAELVDGVTKMRRMNFSTKQDQVFANTRKIMNGLTKDVRIILIKLADRLHNMETLEFKEPQKQKENAIETMELFAPLSLYIGAYSTKNKLEDLSLKYINPSEFTRITEQKAKLQEKEEEYFKEKEERINASLQKNGILHDIIFRSQTITSIYKRIQNGYKIENIYDIFYLKILVEEINECFQTLGLVHEIYSPINGRVKDYIWKPKGFYRSLHTTVSDNVDNVFKVKIRTYDLNKVDAYGIPAYWNIGDRKTIEETNEMIRENCQFAKNLMELDSSFKDNAEFCRETGKEISTDHVYVFNHKGDTIALPKGATAFDFVCQVYPESIDKTAEILVNGKEVLLDYILQKDDRVQIITSEKSIHKNWENYATTTIAKQKIKLLNGQK